MIPRLKYITIVFLIQSLSLLYAQERIFSVLILPPKPIVQTEDTLVYLPVLYRSLEEQLASQRFEVMSRDLLQSSSEFQAIQGETFLPAERVVPIGRSLQANIVVATTYGLEGNRMFIHIKGFDVRTSRLAAAISETGFAGLAGFALSEQSALRFVESLTKYRAQYDPNEPITLEAIVSLVFQSKDEGMLVSLDGREPSGRIVKGELEVPYVPFKVDSTILVRKEKEGYYPEVERVALRPGENRITLTPLQKKFRNEVGVGWTVGEALGVAMEYRRYVEPDYLFVSITERFYSQYDSLKGSHPVLHNDVSLSIGGYVGPYNNRIRIGATLGAGVVITSFTVSDMPVYTDYYFNLGSPFIELNYNPWAIFLMLRVQYGLGMGNHVLGRGFFTIQEGGVPITLGVRRKW
ncbi:MAG: hypothetical protein N2442_10300 [Spirochaetes bacterium]|nr:hypothetical protein [Spirochaetota bacterium]